MIHKSEYLKRQQALLDQLEPSSIVIISAASEVRRSNDTHYPFRQDSDFYYITGFDEPDAVFVLSNQLEGDSLSSSNGDGAASFMFLREKDKHAEVWHGRRLGTEAAPNALGIDEAFDIESFDELLPELLNGHDHLYYCLDKYPDADQAVQGALAHCKASRKQALVAPNHIIDIAPLLHAMRLVKSPQEIEVMRQAAAISAQAHKRAMAFAKPGVYEYQLEAELHHEFAMQGAKHPAYSTIVGSGENACILHYTENSAQIKDGELVLIDAGCELHGYAADITRTFPVNGRFSPQQAALYSLVLEAQTAALARLKPGSTFTLAMDACIEVICKGLVELGILKGNVKKLIKDEAWRPYFMHGLGHYLGLDVHDVGIYKKAGKDVVLQENMLITVEPGIYISSKSDAPQAFQGIGIRIEDDVLITKDGYEILSKDVPKSIKDIEALVGSAHL